MEEDWENHIHKLCNNEYHAEGWINFFKWKLHQTWATISSPIIECSFDEPFSIEFCIN
jgi:hypothetical protein